MMYENCKSLAYTLFKNLPSQLKGTKEIRTVKNFAILIFSLSSEPVTSASAVSLSAGGPTGINIIANQRIGSSERMLVRFARIQTVEMLMLGRVSGCRTISNECDLRWPDSETDYCDDDEWFPGQWTTIVILSAEFRLMETRTYLSSPFFML